MGLLDAGHARGLEAGHRTIEIVCLEAEVKSRHTAVAAVHDLQNGIAELQVGDAEAARGLMLEIFATAEMALVERDRSVEIASVQRMFAERRTAEPTPEGFGEFVLSGEGAADELAVVYGLDLGQHRAGESLSDFMHERLGTFAVVGDRVRLGGIELVVRAVREGRVTMVGLELEDQREKLPARRAARRMRRRMIVWSRRLARGLGRRLSSKSRSGGPSGG